MKILYHYSINVKGEKMEKEMYRTYYENGNLKEECPIRRGKLHGVSTVYREDGEILEKRIYQNDICMGNPFSGQDPIAISEAFGYTESCPEEQWQEAMEEEGDILPMTPEVASIVLLDDKKEKEK